MPDAYNLMTGDRASCHDCGKDFGRFEGVLCDAGCPPCNGEANYTCFSCLDASVTVHENPEIEQIQNSY